MQIAGLSQWDSRQERVKMGKKRDVVDVTCLITKNYKPRSFFAYLRPTLPLVVNTRVMRGSL